jgi:hypothetical protein
MHIPLILPLLLSARLSSGIMQYAVLGVSSDTSLHVQRSPIDLAGNPHVPNPLQWKVLQMFSCFKHVFSLMDILAFDRRQKQWVLCYTSASPVDKLGLRLQDGALCLSILTAWLHAPCNAPLRPTMVACGCYEQVRENPRMMDVAATPGLLESLLESNASLDIVEKGEGPYDVDGWALHTGPYPIAESYLSNLMAT